MSPQVTDETAESVSMTLDSLTTQLRQLSVSPPEEPPPSYYHHNQLHEAGRPVCLVLQQPDLLAESPLLKLNQFTFKNTGSTMRTAFDSSGVQIFSSSIQGNPFEFLPIYSTHFVDNNGAEFMRAVKDVTEICVISGNTQIGVFEPRPFWSLCGGTFVGMNTFDRGEWEFERKDLGSCWKLCCWSFCCWYLCCRRLCSCRSMTYEIRLNGQIVGQILSNSRDEARVRIVKTEMPTKHRAMIAVAAYMLFNTFWQTI